MAGAASIKNPVAGTAEKRCIMIGFINKLQQEVDQSIRNIESGETNILRRSLILSKMLEDMFGRLKEFVSTYVFADEDEEIRFFKEIKPRLFCRLLYYRKVYNIEMNRPMGTLEEQVNYLNGELEHLRQYITKRLDFYRYIRSGSTHHDREYFLRGCAGNDTQYLDSFYFERDPLFSTNGDFRMAKILANDMLRGYLQEELALVGLKRTNLCQTPDPLPPAPRWTGKKNGLIAVLYAFHEMDCIENGNLPLSRLIAHFEHMFDIRLGNVTRAFHEMKYKNNPVDFLDSMRDALLQRLNDSERRCIGKMNKKK